MFNKYCQRVKMANIAQTNNVLQAMILTRGKDMIVTPTYHVFEMFKVHQGATLLPSELVCRGYGAENQQIPELVASASRDAAGTVHISICNLNPNSDSELECLLDGLSPRRVSGRVPTAEKMTAHNTFDDPSLIKPTRLNGSKVNGDLITVTIPAKSVVVLAIK